MLIYSFFINHVGSHQDHIHNDDEFIAEAKLNVCMDTLATKFLDNPPGYLIPSEKPVLFPAQEVCLIKNDNVLQENIPNELVFGEKRDIIEHYFTWNLRVTQQAVPKIDWCCFNYVLPKQKKLLKD